MEGTAHLAATGHGDVKSFKNRPGEVRLRSGKCRQGLRWAALRPSHGYAAVRDRAKSIFHF